MARYTYSGNTSQLGVAHKNFLAALKVDPLTPLAPVSVLAQTQAADDGSFVLEWGTDVDANSEDWAGRICVIVLDDNQAAQKMKSASNDWLVGVVDGTSALISATHWRINIAANNGGIQTAVAEIAFKDIFGVNLDTGNVASAFSSSEANSLNYDDFAFDKNNMNKWTSTLSDLSGYIGYVFDSAVSVGSVDLMGQYAVGDQADYAIKDAEIEYSNDGAAWTALGGGIVNQTGWGAAEVRNFVVQVNTTIVSATHWRINIYANNGGDHTTVAEVVFRSVDGVVIDTSGGHALSKSEANSDNLDDFAFDGDSATKWTSAELDIPTFIGYVFPSPVSVGSISLVGHRVGGPDPNLAIKDAQIEYSTDGQIWVPIGSPIQAQSGWIAGESRSFQVQV